MASVHTQLFHYERFHLDPRNVATHFIGVPMILFAIALLLTRPVIAVGEITLLPIYPAAAFAAIFYFRLHIGLGLVMAVVLGVNVLLAVLTSRYCNPIIAGVVLFVIGWIIQFVGHYYEGKKPAFFEDIRGLLIGPLFIVVKVLFKLGLFDDVRSKVEEIGFKQEYK